MVLLHVQLLSAVEGAVWHVVTARSHVLHKELEGESDYSTCEDEMKEGWRKLAQWVLYRLEILKEHPVSNHNDVVVTTSYSAYNKFCFRKRSLCMLSQLMTTSHAKPVCTYTA